MSNESDHGHGSHGPSSIHHVFDSPEMVRSAEREAAVLSDLTSQALTAISHVQASPAQSILDVGSGPGMGTTALAGCFPNASVIAVDASPAMLSRVSERAAELGLGSRISTMQAEFPDGLETLEQFDLIWASQVLHHTGDLPKALIKLRSLLNPAGLLAIIEPSAPIRISTDRRESPLSDLAIRLADGWSTSFADRWGQASPSSEALLLRAGLELSLSTTLTTTLRQPFDERTLQYVSKHLQGAKHRLAGAGTNEEIAALDELLANLTGSGAMRQSLVFQASQHLTLAHEAAANA